MFEDGEIIVNVIKKFTPANLLVETKIDEQYPRTKSDTKSQYFVEIREKGE